MSADSPPPFPAPKRRNEFLLVFDLPIYRDWIAWLTVTWLVITPLALGTGAKPKSDLPRWADVVFGTATFVVLFGLLPAFLRLALRRYLWRRRAAPLAGPRLEERSAAQMGAAPSGAGPIVAPNQITSSTSPRASTAHRPPSPGSAAVHPIAASPPDEFVQTESLTRARQQLQYPIARAARAIQLAADRREEYEAILSAGEAIAMTLGISITAAMRPVGPSVSSFSELQAAFLGRGVSQGHWISVIASVSGILKNGPEPMRGLAEAVRLGPKGTGIVADLKVLVEERNRWAHGAGPRTEGEAGMRIAAIAQSLQRCLDRSMFLADSPWIYVRASSFRRTQGDFAILASDAMADHPDFERRDFTSQVPLANDTFYMMTERGATDLTPFVVMHDCPECHQAELCHADRLDAKHGVALKSFARGHVMFERALSAEVQNLFESSGHEAG